MQSFETVEVTTDLLIIGPGMAGCGACVESAYWAKENNVKIGVVDKAAMERSGAVAMGLSAINQYQGEIRLSTISVMSGRTSWALP